MANKENDLHKLFIDKLRMLFDVENQVADSLPLMIANASDADLKSAFEEHLEQTRSQVERVKGLIEDFEAEAETLESEAIRGLAKDAESAIEEADKGPLLDVALNAAARSVEHYEISLYETAIDLAESMDHSEAADTLHEILSEEETANDKLRDLSISKLSEQASEDEEEEEEEDEEEE